MIWSALGISTKYDSSKVFRDAASCSVEIAFVIQDRYVPVGTTSLQLENRLYSFSLQVTDLLSNGRIGEIVRRTYTLDLTEIPMGLYRLDYLSPLPQLHLDRLLLVSSEWPRAGLSGWRFISMDLDLDLLVALSMRLDVGVLLPDHIGFALGKSSGSGQWVGVRIPLAVLVQSKIPMMLSVKDTYGSSLTGRVEQQVVVEGRVVWRHDVGESPDGVLPDWSFVDLKKHITPTTSYVDVRVVALQDLGPWGWGAASRTWVSVVSQEHER